MFRICTALVLATSMLACCGGKDRRSEREQPVQRDEKWAVRSLGEPVRGARAWITALARNPRGGWNFIAQTYEYPSTEPTEFVVLDLETGRQTLTEGPPGIYANSNYQMGELRATSGRLFFPALQNHVAYYDPKTERISVIQTIANDDKAIYRMVFGPDGKLYGGTQSNGLPSVFSLDPDTLAVTPLGQVGKQRTGYSYAYYLAADPPWLYVAVGELPWELVAVNIKTKEHRLLATRADEGFIEFDPRPEGIAVKLASGMRTARQTSEVLWCVDGQLVAKPSRPRDVKPAFHPLTDAPELDLANVNPDSSGTGRIRWRDRSGPWREATFRVKRTTPVEIESLHPLPDGTLLGNAKQYHGFFRYDPADNATTRLGPLDLSGGPRATIGNTIYLTGYPNGLLYAFDATKPWSTENPRSLGSFSEAAARYAYFLIPAANGRLYYAGRRERDGVGAGVGFYDPATERFAGHHDGLDTLDPQGLAVVNDKVIFSGRLASGASDPEARLVVYDLELRERERLRVKSGLASTGAIYPTNDKHLVVGLVREANAIYQFDLETKKLVIWTDLPQPLGPHTRRERDGSIWYVAGTDLVRLDPVTFEERIVGQLPKQPNGAEILTWLGDRLYWASGSELREITTPSDK
jgi:hypothetical protein